MFVCYHCHKSAEFSQKENQKAIELDFFDEIENLQAHWKTHHASKKFQFFAIGVAKCFLCDRKESFQKLRKHHNYWHKSEPFIVVDQENPSKCGLCQNIFVSRNEMLEHFKLNHENFFYAEIFSPICFTQNEIDWLLRLKPYKNLDMPSDLENIICGHCASSKESDGSVLKQHLVESDFIFSCCSKCTMVTKNINKLISYANTTHSLNDSRIRQETAFKARLKKHYFRTKLFFTNGLVLFKHNVLKTTLDDRDDFFPFIGRFAENKFSECKEQEDDNESNDSIENFEENRKNATPELEPYDKFGSYKVKLCKQNSYKNNLCIKGVSLIDGVKNNINGLLKLFVGLCKAIDVNISINDVCHIFQRKKLDIIIKMNDFQKKIAILKAWDEHHDKNRFHNKLCMLMAQYPEFKLSNVVIRTDLTPFFKKLWKDAERLQSQEFIHSFCITKGGLLVKVNPKSKGKIVWSQYELMKLRKNH